MSKASRAFEWFRDVTQILVCDRFDSERRRYAESASTACRSLRFHSRCRIKAQPLEAVLKKLGASNVSNVMLPGASTTYGDVGSQSGYYTLGALVAGLQPATILEFGTYLGVSALSMMLNAPARKSLTAVQMIG